MATVLDLGTEALANIGVLASGEVPDAGQSAGFLTALNALVDQFKADSLLTYTVTRTTATLTASQTSFTVGTGGNVNIARPVYIDHVDYVDNSVSPALEVSLGPLLTDDEYAAIPLKSLTATRPSRVYYNPTYPTGTLIPWPISTGASLLWAVYYHAVVAEFSATSDTVALPPGYRQMYVKNLALELAPSYGRQIDPLLVRQAATALAVVKRSNQRAQELGFDLGALPQGAAGGYYDINVGP